MCFAVRSWKERGSGLATCRTRSSTSVRAIRGRDVCRARWGTSPPAFFTPNLREVDHYRYHDKLLPQAIGHTASKNGEIRYSPGSWLQRDYIAIDVGRQHGTGNGGLLLTDFGWVEVTPGGPARLIEVTPLFVRLAHEAAAGGRRPDEQGESHLGQMLTAYFRAAKSGTSSLGEIQEALFMDLSPSQVV